jgi:hypothetical protein
MHGGRLILFSADWTQCISVEPVAAIYSIICLGNSMSVGGDYRSCYLFVGKRLQVSVSLGRGEWDC